MIKRLRVTVDGSTYDVTVEVPEEATPSGASTPAVVATPPPTPLAAGGPAASPAPAAPAPKAPATPSGSSGPGDVLCPLSGRVTAVLVQPGQEVKEGDHLLTLEAMKMNTFVFAPRGGKVTAVRAEVGSVVEEKQVLVIIG